MRRRSASAGFVRIAAWNVLLIAIAVGAAELAFGGWLDSVRDPALWRLSIYRNVAWTFSAERIYGRTEPVLYRRDRYGLRGDFGSPDRVNILAIGGSTTDERYLSEGETWTDTLARCLNGAGRTARIANAGVSGQSTRGHIRNFEVWLNRVPGLRPRHVVAYIGVNERLLDERAREDDAERYQETDLPLWLERAKLRSALYAVYRLISGNLVAWRAGIHHVRAASAERIETAAADIDRRWREAASSSLAVDSGEHARRLSAAKAGHGGELAAYAGRLARLADAIRGFGAEPVFVTQTDAGFRLEDGVVRGDLGRYFTQRAFNDTTMEFCAKSGLRCLDLGRDFAAVDGDFYDMVHVTPQGSKKAGEMICRGLLADPMFAASPGATPSPMSLPSTSAKR
jgi:hypothetical protein